LFNRRNQFLTYREKDIEMSELLKDEKFQLKELEALVRFYDYLGYNMLGEFIYPVVNHREGTFSWLTTVNGTYQTTEFTIQDNKKITYQLIKNYDILDHLLKHTYPLECKNPKIKLDNYGYEIPNNLKYIDKDICGATIKKESDRLLVDLDCHSHEPKEQYKIFNDAHLFITYLEELNYTPDLIEKSREGGYHFYIKLDKIYSWKDKLNFINDFNLKNNTHLEIKDRMRFPYSYQYQPINRNEEIFTIPESRIKAYENNSNLFIKANTNIIEEKEIKEPKKNKIIPIISNIYERTNKSKIKHYTPEEFLNTTNISISSGHRHYEMLELVRIGKFNGWSIDEIKFVILQLNTGSKNLSIWSDDKIKSIIEKIYNKCKIEYREHISTRPEEFISNIKIIPMNIRELLEDEILLKSILYKSRKKITDLNITKCRIILMEMMGYYYYNIINPKKTKNNKSKKYLKGMQYSQQYADKLKEYYFDDLENTDVMEFINLIVKCSGIFHQNFINSKGWYYNSIDKKNNFCRLFNLKSNVNNNIINNLNTLSINIIRSVRSSLISLVISNFLYRVFLNKIDNQLERLKVYEEKCFSTG